MVWIKFAAEGEILIIELGHFDWIGDKGADK